MLFPWVMFRSTDLSNNRFSKDIYDFTTRISPDFIAVVRYDSILHTVRFHIDVVYYNYYSEDMDPLFDVTINDVKSLEDALDIVSSKISDIMDGYDEYYDYENDKRIIKTKSFQITYEKIKERTKKGCNDDYITYEMNYDGKYNKIIISEIITDSSSRLLNSSSEIMLVVPSINDVEQVQIYKARLLSSLFTYRSILEPKNMVE